MATSEEVRRYGPSNVAEERALCAEIAEAAYASPRWTFGRVPVSIQIGGDNITPRAIVGPLDLKGTTYTVVVDLMLMVVTDERPRDWPGGSLCAFDPRTEPAPQE
jgi:hypothetical protein